MENPAAESSEYELLDAGDGRQLARFGDLIVDRPYPAAIHPVADPAAWAMADLRYERPSFGGAGEWIAVANEVPEAWTMRHAGMTFELRPTASGQVGFFGEQADLWPWIRDAVRRLPQTAAPPAPTAQPAPTAPLAVMASPSDGEAQLAAALQQSARPSPADDEPRIIEPSSASAEATAVDAPAVLNLFAYTGGSTLAAVVAGAAVTHVDASRPAVAWARRNAELSGLAELPVRWIVDDAMAFVRREARRDRRYNGLILDPPSYGHGPSGERWTLEQHLPVLLDACLAVAAQPGFVLLTAHAGGMQPQDVEDALRQALIRAGRRRDAAHVESGALELRAQSGVTVPAGVFARWQSAPAGRDRP